MRNIFYAKKFQEAKIKEDIKMNLTNICILPNIRMEILPELTVSYNNYVLADIEMMMAKTEEGIYNRARAGMVAIDAANEAWRKRLKKQLYLKLERIVFESKEKQEKEEFDCLEQLRLKQEDHEQTEWEEKEKQCQK